MSLVTDLNAKICNEFTCSHPSKEKIGNCGRNCCEEIAVRVEFL